MKKRAKIVTSQYKASASIAGDGIHEKNRRLAGDTPEKETGQLLILESTCMLLPSINTGVSISAFSRNVLSFLHSFVMKQNEFLNADGSLFLHAAIKIGFPSG